MTHLKLRYTFSILIVLFYSFSCNQIVKFQQQNELMKLLQNKDYFELRNAYQDQSDLISTRTDLEIKAHLWNTFNKNEESNMAIDQLLNEYKPQLRDSTISNLLEVNADNYLKLFDYKAALAANNLNILFKINQ
jgi:hypothetical protein